MINHAYKPIIARKAKTEPKTHRKAPPRYNALCLLDGRISQKRNSKPMEVNTHISQTYILSPFIPNKPHKIEVFE
jgi:hypothetical protein